MRWAGCLRRHARSCDFSAAAFRGLIVACLSTLLAFLLVSQPLLLLGGYRSSWVVGGTFLGAVGLFRLWWPRACRSRTPEPSGPVVLAAVALILGLTLLNAAYSAQHLSLDRDPAIYNIVGIHLAEEGTTEIDPSSELFEPRPQRFHADTVGLFPDGEALRPQYANALPSVLAIAHSVGGTFLLHKTNALLGGLALLMFFAFVSRLVDARIALVATLVLGASPVFAWFARDSYSEPLTLALVFGGLWALAESRAADSILVRLLAGLLLGATAMARLDGVAIALGLAAYLCVEWLSHRPTHEEGGAPGRTPKTVKLPLGLSLRLEPWRRLRRPRVAATALGAAAMVALSITNVAALSPTYYASNSASLSQSGDALLALVALTVVASTVGGRLPGLAPAVRRHGHLLTGAAALTFLALGLYAYFVAPSVEMRTAGPGGLPTGGEHSLRWISWYAGPVTVLAGVAGVGLLIYRVRSERFRVALPFLLIFASHAFLYLWDPRITPDHIWAMRRFLPVVLPGLIIGAAMVAASLLALRPRGLARGAACAAAGALLLIAVAVPARQLESLTARTQVPLRTEIERLCVATGPAAAIVIPGLDRSAAILSHSIREICRVPVALGDGAETQAFYSRTAERLVAAGRQLYVVSTGEVPYDVPTTKVVDIPVDELERTFDRRPEATTQVPVVLWTARF